MVTGGDLRSLLAQLVAIPGVSGHEQSVAAWLAHVTAPLADKAWHDPFGNLVLQRQSTQADAPRLMFVAHMDCVGLAVRRIEEDGFLRLEKLGGTDNRVLLGRSVSIGSAGGAVPGVIGVKPYHLHRGLERRAPSAEHLYIDVGATSASEVESMGIQPGDPVAFAGGLGSLGRQRVSGPGLDDRVGCALLVALLQAVAGEALPMHLYVVFSVQEEVGTRGARYLAPRADVDAVVVLDTGAAGDTPDVKTGGLKLGGGPGIKRMDAGLIAHPAVWRRLVDAAVQAGAPYQLDVGSAGSTDGRELQVTAPTGGISIPCRYTHSPVEVIDLIDVAAALALLVQLVRRPWRWMPCSNRPANQPD